MSPAPTLDPVPFIDLKLQNRKVQAEVLQAFGRIAESQGFINGPDVGQFEKAMGAYLGAPFALGVSSGTDALLMALMALGVGPGDEVITTPFTFVATAEVVLRQGAKVVFSDIHPRSLNLTAAGVESVVGPRTKALLPVYLFGRISDAQAFERLAKKTGVPLIEDCAQAMGAREGGRQAGSFGSIGAYSFFPTKNLGGWGDGGLVSCRDEAVFLKLKAIREHGGLKRDTYDQIGGNFRLDTLQAAVLQAKLCYLGGWLAQRRQAGLRYLQLLEQAGLLGDPELLLPPLPGEDGEHTFNLFVIQVRERDGLKAFLAERGIASAVYYPTPLHLQPLFANLGFRAGAFPVAEAAAQRVLSLPLYPAIPEEHQVRVVEAIRDFTRRG